MSTATKSPVSLDTSVSVGSAKTTEVKAMITFLADGRVVFVEDLAVGQQPTPDRVKTFADEAELNQHVAKSITPTAGVQPQISAPVQANVATEPEKPIRRGGKRKAKSEQPAESPKPEPVQQTVETVQPAKAEEQKPVRRGGGKGKSGGSKSAEKTPPQAQQNSNKKSKLKVWLPLGECLGAAIYCKPGGDPFPVAIIGQTVRNGKPNYNLAFITKEPREHDGGASYFAYHEKGDWFARADSDRLTQVDLY